MDGGWRVSSRMRKHTSVENEILILRAHEQESRGVIGIGCNWFVVWP